MLFAVNMLLATAKKSSFSGYLILIYVVISDRSISSTSAPVQSRRPLDSTHEKSNWGARSDDRRLRRDRGEDGRRPDHPAWSERCGTGLRSYGDRSKIRSTSARA